jgi:hypothetical protein
MRQGVFPRKENEMGRQHSSGKTIASLVVLFALLVAVALIFFGLRGSGPDLQNIVGNTIKKMDLLSEMRVNLLRSQETEKSAVMADTDEASRDFADQSRRAAEIVDRDRRELEALLNRDHADQEMKLFHEFEGCWTELRKIDQEILDFAVQNTNIKAVALSFGEGNEAMKRFVQALRNLIHSPITGKQCTDVIVPTSDALVAGLRLQASHAPHIVEASDARMDEIEVEMRRDAEMVEASLKKLAGLVSDGERKSLLDARTAFDSFTAITAEVIKLSRKNTNVKSFVLSLGKKRKVAAQCDEVLVSMQEAVRKREFKATR